MNEAVFISDLHLSPLHPEITERFKAWVEWALFHTRKVYILGDFFHAWSGDDTFDEWSGSIAEELARFADQNIPVYFMHGNRDFLLGNQFKKLAKIQYIQEPYCFKLNSMKVLLVHGDRYCTLDKQHQWFRCLTRNKGFIRLFLCLPRSLRLQLVEQTRKQSRKHQSQIYRQAMEVVQSSLETHVKQLEVDVVIHGHTHQPKMIQYPKFKHIILSDWEEIPPILCYDHSKGFYFNLNWN